MMTMDPSLKMRRPFGNKACSTPPKALSSVWASVWAKAFAGSQWSLVSAWMVFGFAALVAHSVHGAVHPRSFQAAERQKLVGNAVSSELLVAFEEARANPSSAGMVATFGRTASGEIDLNLFLPDNISGVPHDKLVPAMIDAGLNRWMNSPMVRNSAYGRAANQIEGTMRQEVVWGGGDESDSQAQHPESEGGTGGQTAANESSAAKDPFAKKKQTHKVATQLLPLQTAAKLTYEGYARATVIYQALTNQAQIEISNTIAKDTDFVLSHAVQPAEKVSHLTLRLSW